MKTLDKLKYVRRRRKLFKYQNRDDMYWFFREQFRYGHREILLDYLGISWDHLLLGFLQHGHGIRGADKTTWPWQERPRSLNNLYQVFVWSSATEEKARALNRHHVTAIGSPWLYLLENMKIKPFDLEMHKKQMPLIDFLIVPEHGTGHYNVSQQYKSLPAEFRKLIGKKSASVVLGYTEFLNPEVRKYWEEFEFKVESNGMAWGPETRTLWTYNGGRPDFLKNTLKLLTNHKNVIASGPTTMCQYAISLGIPTKICKSNELPNVFYVANEGKGVERLRKMSYLSDEISQLMLGESYNTLDISDEKIEITKQRLGLNSVKSKSELKGLLPLQKGLVPLPNAHLIGLESES